MFAKIHERWASDQVALWQGVRDQIHAKPEEFDQSDYCDCIAGKAHILSPCSDPHIGWSWFSCAADSLGLSFTESLIVFSAIPVEWPDPLNKINYSADKAVRAGIAVAYIDWIIGNGRVAA